MAENKDFSVFLQNKRIPVCILDQKWHKLFALKGKPDDVVECEQELNDLLKHQGQLNNEIKELKKLKTKLMGNIVENMEGTHEENEGRISSKKLDEDKRLIDEINEKLEAHEDELLDLPREIGRVNKELMLLTVRYCYANLRTNVAEIREVTDWITQVRIDLKKNIIRKQNREINSRQIYAYMHDIFGAQMMDVFDLDNDDIDLSVLLEKPKKKEPAQTPDSQTKHTDAAHTEDPPQKKTDGKPDGSVTKKGDGVDEEHKKENFDASSVGSADA